MSRGLTRKEIKRNEFVEAVTRSMDYASSHSRIILLSLAGVVLVGVAVGGTFLYLKSRENRASAALDRALDAYHAEIVPDDPKPNDPFSPTFADEAARQQRARELFAAVKDGYGSSEAAVVAAAFLGRIAAGEGDLEEARKQWQEVLDGTSDTVLATEVRLNLLRLDLQEGKAEEVAAELEAMLDDPRKETLPEDVILFELASVRERLGRTSEALSAYQRIVDEFPGSPYSGEARQRASSLGSAPLAS